MQAETVARAYAEQLHARTGGLWLGMWGHWSRRLWAIYCGPSEQPICLGAADQRDLWQQIEAVETALSMAASRPMPPGSAR